MRTTDQRVILMDEDDIPALTREIEELREERDLGVALTSLLFVLRQMRVER